MVNRVRPYLLLVAPLTLMITATTGVVAQTPEDDGPVRPFILDDIRVETRDVFDSSNAVPIVGPLIEHFHAVTKPKVVAQEVFRAVGDTVTQYDLDEMEQNMRGLTIFSLIEFKVDYVPPADSVEEDPDALPHAILTVKTRDAWSLRFSGYFSNSERSLAYGTTLEEANLLGLGKSLAVSADYSNREDRGWRYGLAYLNPNVFGSHVELGGSASVAGAERVGSFFVGRPFFSDRTPYAFSTGVTYFLGNEVSYTHSNSEVVSSSVPIHRTALGGWYSSAKGASGEVFRTSLDIQYNRAFRDGPSEHPRAFENSVWVFGGISSRRRSYTKIVNADMDGEVQVPIGGMGSVSIGKISPVHGGLDNVAYVGADASQAVRSGDLYGYASIAAGTGLAGKSAQFTSEKVVASGAWLTHPGALVARFEQSTLWNWPRYVALPLDNSGGLRGYPPGELFGDNKMLLNIDYRLTPVVRVLWFDLGVAAFYDVGSVWRQAEKISQARFHSSAGFGLRVANANGTINKGLLRVDLAYNFDERRLGRIIISSQEAFDFFGTLDYRPPAPYIF
jgi:hypothetical protein